MPKLEYRRPMVGSIHTDDWQFIQKGVDIAQQATRELKAAGVRIEIPTEFRWWEYGSAIQLVDYLLEVREKVDVVDIGSGWGVVGPALILEYGKKVEVSEYEPDQMYWADRANCNAYLQRTKGQEIYYHHFDLSNMPAQDYDAVFCISVMEHVPFPQPERGCWYELAKRVRPGGVLFMDCDLVPERKPFGSYRFDELRAHNYIMDEVKERVEWLKGFGLKPIGVPDFQYNGSVVHDFTFFRIAMRRPV